jgi:hypothetical protein
LNLTMTMMIIMSSIVWNKIKICRRRTYTEFSFIVPDAGLTPPEGFASIRNRVDFSYQSHRLHFSAEHIKLIKLKA